SQTCSNQLHGPGFDYKNEHIHHSSCPRPALSQRPWLIWWLRLGRLRGSRRSRRPWGSRRSWGSWRSRLWRSWGSRRFRRRHRTWWRHRWRHWNRWRHRCRHRWRHRWRYRNRWRHRNRWRPWSRRWSRVWRPRQIRIRGSRIWQRILLSITPSSGSHRNYSYAGRFEK
ncbi:unnamed protein product, partial [Lymnaea stagnalis]